MNIELLYDGLFVMAIGMGMVFLFLVIMIYAMKLMSFCMRILNKYCPEEVPETNVPRAKKSSNDEEIALAIACAIHQAKV